MISNKFSPLIYLLLGTICGLSTVLIVMNIGHDAAHNALSGNKKVNSFMCWAIELAGISHSLWKINHNIIHHPYPNIFELCIEIPLHINEHSLLVARSEDLLKEFAEYLSQKYAVQTHYLRVDLSEINASKKISDWCNLHNFSISILINNAGYALSGKLEKYSLQEHIDLMNVNMIACVELIYLLLAKLKEQPKAYIMNIASGAAYRAVPGLNIYAATKAFVLSFSRGLRYE